VDVPCECVDSCPDVVVDVLEGARLAGTVAHSPIIETEGRITGLCESSGETYELTMASRTVLRATDNDDDSGRKG